MRNYKIFSKTLPTLWQIAATIKILTEGFITYMALNVHTHGNNYVIFGAVLSSVLSFIMYMYSDAKQMLNDIGKSLDLLLNRCLGNTNTLIHPIEIRQTKFEKTMTATAATCITANTVINGISAYQEYILLLDQYLALNKDLSDSDREMQRKLITWLVIYMFIATGAYNNMAFQGSFSAKLIEHLNNKYHSNSSSYTALLRDEESGLHFSYDRATTRPLIHEQNNSASQITNGIRRLRTYSA